MGAHESSQSRGSHVEPDAKPFENKKFPQDVTTDGRVDHLRAQLQEAQRPADRPVNQNDENRQHDRGS
ncbi:hypothetical protein Ddc_13420 [Ditylenchus destructor]|nr:hypothetical protein Ddc_13420 [Ditylenchus destructor]